MQRGTMQEIMQRLLARPQWGGATRLLLVTPRYLRMPECLLATARRLMGGIVIGEDAGDGNGYCIIIGHGAQDNSCSEGVGIGQFADIRGNAGITLGMYGEAYASGIAIGKYASAPASGFVVSIGDSVNERGMFSGAFNSTSSATDGYLNIFDNKLQVSGDGSVKVNNQYTFPTGVTLRLTITF